MRWHSSVCVGLLVLVAACGDRVVGTTHASPGLTPLDATDASAPPPAPAGEDAGTSAEAAAPTADAAADAGPHPPRAPARRVRRAT